MADYFAMDRAALTTEKAQLEAEYKKFQAMGLKLNMARGKPGPHQMDLAMDLLKMDDYTTDDGFDARNYGNLEGLYEARELFADVMGVKPEEVFVGGNSSLQLMYNLVAIGYMFGYPESPSTVEPLRKTIFAVVPISSIAVCGLKSDSPVFQGKRTIIRSLLLST